MQRKPQTIDEIIHSFRKYGLEDILHNKERAIAAFILAICFIDQLASFRYSRHKRMPLADKWEHFIEEYIPIYKGLNIYNGFRNTLIHNYSSCRKFGLTNDSSFVEPYSIRNGFVIINTDIFIKNLEIGFQLFEMDLKKSNSEANYNTIQWSITHPVLTSSIT